MIVKYFNHTKPINFVFLSILLSVFVLISLYLKHSLVFTSNNTIGVFLLLASFFLFNFISKKWLTSSDKDFGILFYVLLSGLFYVPTENNSLLISNFLIYLALIQIFNLKNKEINVKKQLFNSGLLIGIASLFYPLSFLFLGVVLVSVFVFNHISWRSIIIPFIGFIVPFLFIYVLKDLFGIVLFTKLYPLFTPSLPYLFQSTILSISSGVLLLLGLASMLLIISKINTDFVFYRGFNSIIISYLIISLFILLFDENKNGSELIFILLPLSILLANALSIVRSQWISNSLVFIIIGLIILNYLGIN